MSYNTIILQDVGVDGSHVYAINASGQSVGNSATTSGEEAVLWSKSGKATVLQDVGGIGASSVGDINAFGRYLGGKVPFGFRLGDAGELFPNEAEQERYPRKATGSAMRAWQAS